MKRISTLILYFALLAVIWPSGATYAAAKSGAWKDSSNITYNGKTYTSPPLNIDFDPIIKIKARKFYIGGKDDRCVNHIRNISADKKSAELIVYGAKATLGCTGGNPQPITLEKPNNASLWLKWKDAKTITWSDGTHAYKQTATIDGGRTKVYTSSTSGNCPHTINVGTDISRANYAIKQYSNLGCQTKRTLVMAIGGTSAASKTPSGGTVGNTQVNNTGFSGGGSGSSGSGSATGSTSTTATGAAATDPCDPANLKKDATATPEERGAGCSIESSINACYDVAGFLSFVLCPVINLAADAIQHLIGWTEELLVVSPLSQDPNDPIYILWKSFRDLANVAFVLVFLVMIFANALWPNGK